MNITFERATPTDATDLVQIQIRAFHHDAEIYPGVEIGGPPGYDSMEEVIKDIENYPYYKIIHDGRIVGGIILFDRGGGHFHIDRIYLEPDVQNRGIGMQAMQFIERTYPARKWTLDTPVWAIRNQHLYEKLGYVKVGEKVEEGEGIILISYEKRL